MMDYDAEYILKETSLTRDVENPPAPPSTGGAFVHQVPSLGLQTRTLLGFNVCDK